LDIDCVAIGVFPVFSGRETTHGRHFAANEERVGHDRRADDAEKSERG
jgi:hypothetical protein